ncbi:MAG: hypothetical protein EPN26_12245 [Rhodospirillales bacterium]|nr:MAG: hypothetical protein EPN26_12245 [Rhodospirillales bacterium]
MENFAGCEAIATVANKAYKTNIGARIIETMTKEAGRLQDDLKLLGEFSDLKQLKYLERLRDAISNVTDILSEDMTSGPDSLACSVAKGDIAGDPISIKSCISIRDADFELQWNLSGSVSIYGLSRVLNSLVRPIENRIDWLEAKESMMVRGNIDQKAIIFALDEALEIFSKYFRGKTASLKRGALVSAFYVGLTAGYPTSSMAQVRIGQLLQKRKNFSVQRPIHRSRR